MSEATDRMTESLAFGPLVVGFDERVLRPRSWTLAQSEWATELSGSLPPGPVLELCCGAGHIGLAVAALTGRRLVQVDLNEVACQWAAANAERAGLSARVEVRHGSMETAVGDDERFPLVVADPPYIPTAGIDRFPDDPELAIDGGPSGMDLILRSLDVAGSHLAPAGSVLLQVGGADQVDAVASYGNDSADSPLVMVDSRSFGPTRSLVRLSRRG